MSGLLHWRLLLTHRIAAIGAIGVLGVLLVGGIYPVGTSEQARHQRLAEHAEATFAQANSLYLQMLESRRSEKDFLLRNDMKYAERVGALGAAIMTELKAL